MAMSDGIKRTRDFGSNNRNNVYNLFKLCIMVGSFDVINCLSLEVNGFITKLFP